MVPPYDTAIVQLLPQPVSSPQRCDVMVSAEGAIRVAIAGDWLAEEHLNLLQRALVNVVHFPGPLVVDLSEAGQLSQAVSKMLRHLRNRT